MSDQSARELPNALKPTPAGRRRWGAWLRTLAVTLAVLLVLTGVQVGVRVLPPDAVQVTASAAASGQTLARATVNDKGTVADWYARINSLPAIDLLYKCSGSPPVPHAVTVKLDFLRWGLPIEVATLAGNSCAWDVSQGVIPSARDDPTGQTSAILFEVRTLLPTVPWP
jgi:hypothetical protein